VSSCFRDKALRKQVKDAFLGSDGTEVEWGKALSGQIPSVERAAIVRCDARDAGGRAGPGHAGSRHGRRNISQRIFGFGDGEKPADGATDEQPLLVNTQEKWLYDWSRDGRFILYGVTADPKTGGDLSALPLTGDRKPFSVVQTSFEEFGGQFSPDERWLAYASNESGRFEIYVRPFPGPRAKWQVSTAGGTQPRWRRDGKELFYVAPDNRLMAVLVGLAADAPTVDVGPPVALFPTRLASGAGLGSAGSVRNAQYDIATDGRLLMNVAVEEATAPPITIVQNWLAGLEK
jgi:hypothetical protein